MGNFLTLVFLVGDVLKLLARLHAWAGGGGDHTPITPDAAP